MKKRTLTAAALAVVFVLALATPALAGMDHTATYQWDGTVDMQKQVGHLCNTGAEMKQDITGDGKMDKTMDVAMSEGVLTVDDANDFVTADDATDNLTVTSVITLCAPAKQMQSTTDYVYSETEGWKSQTGPETKANVYDLYEGNVSQHKSFYDWALDQAFQDGNGDLAHAIQSDDYTVDEAIAAYADESAEDWRDEYGMTGKTNLNALTDQIWAVQVEANPGMSGNVHQDFEAAYGHYGAYDDGFWFVEDDTFSGWDTVAGDDYVGNYFHMDQWARTSDGTLKRFIDISEPFEGTYLMEDFEVTGEAEVEEAFAMNNVAAGADATVTWYDLFY